MVRTAFEGQRADRLAAATLLFTREQLIQKMSAVNRELERTSDMLKTDRCAVVMTDRDDLATTVNDALSGTGLSPYRTRDSEEARRAATAPFVQALVLDLRLAGVADAARAASSRTPPAMVVGVGPDERLAADVGAAAVLPLPLDVEALRALLRLLLNPQPS